VRVSGSGLGCSDWPTCDGSNITPMPGGGGPRGVAGLRRVRQPAAQLAGARGGGRSSGGSSAARAAPRRRPAAGLLLPLGVLGQIVLGGITVLTGLSPVTVAAHFLALDGADRGAAGVYELVREPDGRAAGRPRGCSTR
jgi:heme a synthase